MSNSVIVLSVTGVEGRICLANLEARLGAATHDTGQGHVAAVRYPGNGVEQRVFTLDGSFTRNLGVVPVTLLPGVTAAVIVGEPSCELRGSGAELFQMVQSVPGLKPQKYPPLPEKWQAAIWDAAA